MYFHIITNISYISKMIEDLSLLTTEQVMERNNSKIGSMVAEGGYDNLSKSLTRTIKINISPPYYLAANDIPGHHHR